MRHSIGFVLTEMCANGPVEAGPHDGHRHESHLGSFLFGVCPIEPGARQRMLGVHLVGFVTE